MYGVSVCYGAIYLKRDDEVAVFYLKYKKGGGRERESVCVCVCVCVTLSFHFKFMVPTSVNFYFPTCSYLVCMRL